MVTGVFVVAGMTHCFVLVHLFGSSWQMFELMRLGRRNWLLLVSVAFVRVMFVVHIKAITPAKLWVLSETKSSR